MVGAKAQHAEEWLSRLLLPGLERFPCTRQQIVAPACQKIPIHIEHRRFGNGKAGMIDGQRFAAFASALVIVGNEMKKHALDIIAKSAAFGIGPFQFSTKEFERELLKEIIGDVAIAHD